MSIARASRIKNEMCYIQICIDEYDSGEIRGRLFNAYYKDAIFFDSCLEMIRKLDEIFDTFGYPHATMDLRRFDDDPNEAQQRRARRLNAAPVQDVIRHDARGKLATLRCRIMFRQNASWQGIVRWMEEELEDNFQSVLELLMLIDSIFVDDPAEQDN